MIITLKPEKTTKKFLSVLPQRSQDILIRRFGLGNGSQRVTLESIGRGYGITRERVRQIEANALRNIKKSEIFDTEKQILDELEKIIYELGGVVSENNLLDYLSKKNEIKNHFYFLLVLGDSFRREKENRYFKARWSVDNELLKQVHSALNEISNSLNKNDLHPEDKIIKLFLDNAKNIHSKYKKDEIIKSWLSISKLVDKNHFNEWGLASSNNIKAKGIRDFAYLSIRQQGNPMHFREVAKSIENNFNRKAHIATCHNELIKDPRFVLVGRGLYALSEWGYTQGVVRDVIREILKQNGALTKEEIIEKVLRERYIKENTVVVNLHDPKYFRRNKMGKFVSI